MPKLLMEVLDPYSRVAVPLVLERFPEWERFAALNERPDGQGATVEFLIRCPSPAADHGLSVSTAEQELTVGFHTHHAHFTDYETPLNPDLIRRGLDHAADILAERAGILSWYRGGESAGSRSVRLPLDGSVRELLFGSNADAWLQPLFAGCERVTVRSWLGRFDCDESLF